MKLPKVSAVLVLFAMSAAFSPSQFYGVPESGIEGVITISPARPGPIRAHEPASVPLANTTFIAENNDGEVASFTTDNHGQFRVSLPPGHYKVSLKARKSTIGRFGPFEVDVGSGKMTKVQWECDSGIR